MHGHIPWIDHDHVQRKHNDIHVKKKARERQNHRQVSNKRFNFLRKRADNQTHKEEISGEYQEIEKGLWGENLPFIKKLVDNQRSRLKIGERFKGSKSTSYQEEQRAKNT